MNKLYQQLQTQQMAQNLSSQLKPVKQMFNAVKMAQNPQLFFNNLLGQNPQLQSIIQLVNNSGKNPRDLFYEMAKQQGVDPEEILRSLI